MSDDDEYGGRKATRWSDRVRTECSSRSEIQLPIGHAPSIVGCPQPSADTLQDDELLNEAVTDLQEVSGELDNDAWNEVARRVGGRRRGKECRERWENKLRPGLKEGAWTKAEFEQVKRMVEVCSPQCRQHDAEIGPSVRCLKRHLPRREPGFRSCSAPVTGWCRRRWRGGGAAAV